MKSSIGIKEENLSKVVAILNGVLADEIFLYLKTRSAHWNVEGPHFHALHKFFEDQYEQLDKIIDDVAERIRALGHYPVVSLNVKDEDVSAFGQKGTTHDGVFWIRAILTDHETIIRQLRAYIDPVANELGDAGTGDFISSLMVAHEKMAWMLRAHKSG